jgi:hypothetical protein
MRGVTFYCRHAARIQLNYLRSCCYKGSIYGDFRIVRYAPDWDWSE